MTPSLKAKFALPILLACLTACAPEDTAPTDPNRAAVDAFIFACVNTASNPNAAPGRLQEAGFTETTLSKGDISFDSPFATAIVFGQDRQSQFGRCSVRPKIGDAARTAALLQSLLKRETPPARRADDPLAWKVGPSVIFLNRGTAAMTRS